MTRYCMVISFILFSPLHKICYRLMFRKEMYYATRFHSPFEQNHIKTFIYYTLMYTMFNWTSNQQYSQNQTIPTAVITTFVVVSLLMHVCPLSSPFRVSYLGKISPSQKLAIEIYLLQPKFTYFLYLQFTYLYLNAEMIKLFQFNIELDYWLNWVPFPI